ncbi:MAG: TonB-dependent receptor [Caulobacter sp.]|nr:TonB-dependent receptor [Caulobacter sp.]
MNTVPAGVGLLGALLATSTACAQATTPAGSPPAPAPAPATSPPPAPSTSTPAAPTTVQAVEVRAVDTPMKSSIDRRSYSIEGDLQATTGSIADALKRVPSVEVDIEGNIKLRGDSSVTILIDGKPSGVMTGPGRADALQQLPADQIERVEVLTNPGAQYSPEGSAGIINLVTKKGRRAGAGASGSVRFNLGTEDRYNGGINWAYNGRALSLSANAGLWRSGNRFDSTGDRTLSSPGEVFLRLQTTSAESRGLGGNLRLAADYDLDPRNRISGEANAFVFGSTFGSDYRFENLDGAGALLNLTERRTASDADGTSTSASLSWRREFTGDDHNLTLRVERDRWVWGTISDDRLDTLAPPDPTQFEDSDSRYVSSNLGVKGDYSRPMPTTGRLKAGFDFQKSREDSDVLLSTGPAADSTVLDPTRSHRLLFDETVLSGYLTYERPFGDLTVLGGLRFESATDDINLLTTGLKTSHGYDRVYPSLHLDYRLSDTSRLKASYGLRIRRPGAYDLDPWLVYIDAFNYRQGNPDLEPSETRSWEASWEYRKGGNYYLATGFWRQTDGEVTDVLVDLGGGVLLTTKANLAESRSGGLEFVINRKLTSTLGLNLTGTAQWSQIDAASLGFGGDRSTWSLGGRASFDWQVTPVDLLQVNAVATGKRITPQGFTEPTYSVNLGYRRKLDDRWFLTVTATDIFDSLESRTVTDSPGLSGTYVRRGSTRGLFVGLRYRFGAAKPQRDPAFDYSAGSGGGGPPN